MWIAWPWPNQWWAPSRSCKKCVTWYTSSIVSSKEDAEKNRTVIYYTCHYVPCTVAYSSMYFSLMDDVLELNVEGGDLPCQRLREGSPWFTYTWSSTWSSLWLLLRSSRISQDLQVHGRFEISEIIWSHCLWKRSDGVVDLTCFACSWGFYLGVRLAVSRSAATLFRCFNQVFFTSGLKSLWFPNLHRVILTPDWNQQSIERCHSKCFPLVCWNLGLRSTCTHCICPMIS